VPGERVGARLEGWQAEGGARAGAPCCTAPNNALEPTPTASARTSLRLLARLTAGVRLRGSDLMQIRRAEAADEEALASIRRRAILALAVPAMSREQAERWATRGAADRVARAMREHDVWVAVEGAAIGWVEVDRDRVAALYVSPSCSRRGVGSVLLTFAETSIRSSGYTTARLESSQNALDYYLRRGYLRCGPADSDGAWPLRKDLAAAATPNQGTEPTR
jgi:putative acetyltransferase